MICGPDRELDKRMFFFLLASERFSVPRSWVPGFLGSWAPGFLGSWVPGFLGSLVPGVPGFLGFLGSLVPGFLASCSILGSSSSIQTRSSPIQQFLLMEPQSELPLIPQSPSLPGCGSMGMPRDHWAALYILRSQNNVREPIYKVVPCEHGRCALGCLVCFDRNDPDKKPFLLIPMTR